VEEEEEIKNLQTRDSFPSCLKKFKDKEKILAQKILVS